MSRLAARRGMPRFFKECYSPDIIVGLKFNEPSLHPAKGWRMVVQHVVWVRRFVRFCCYTRVMTTFPFLCPLSTYL